MQWSSFEKWIKKLEKDSISYKIGFSRTEDETLGTTMVKNKKRTGVVQVYFEGPGENDSTDMYVAHLLVINLEGTAFVMIDHPLRYTGGTETSSEDQLWDNIVEDVETEVARAEKERDAERVTKPKNKTMKKSPMKKK